MNEALAHWFTRHRFWLAFASLILVAVMGYGVRYSEIRADYKIYFDDNNPYLQANEYLDDTFTSSENIAFLIDPQQGDVFTRETLTAIQELTEAGWRMPYASRVDSITNHQHTYAQGDQLTVEPLFENPAEMSREKIAERREVALTEPLLKNNLVGADGQATMVSVRVILPEEEGNEERTAELVDAARELRAEFEDKYPDLEILLFGQQTINNTFNEMTVHDSTVLTPIMFALLFAALFALFMVVGARIATALASAVATMIVIGFSSLAAMGAAGWLGISLNAATAIAPTIILTIAVADCVHVLFSWLHARGTDLSRVEAVRESLDINLQPVFLTSLTTAIGFLALNFSDTPPMRNLGTLTAIGVAIALLLSFTLLPALASLIPGYTRTLGGAATSGAMRRLANEIITRRWLYFWGALVFAAVALTGIPRNDLNDSPQTYFDESVEFPKASRFYEEEIGGFDRISFALDSNETNGINEPAFLKKVERFVDWLEQQSGVVHINSYTYVIKRLNKNMHAGQQDWYRIPDSRQLAAQYLLLYELSLPQGLDLHTLIDQDKSALRIDVRLRGKDPHEVIAAEDRYSRWFDDNLPDIEATPGSSTSIMFAHMGQRNINSMFTGNAVAVILIMLVLMVALRSWKLGLLSVLPNAIPALITIGLWGHVRGEVNMAVALIFVVSLGIVVDDTVHFLSKYLRARRKKGFAPDEAIRYAFDTVGNALVITSLVLTAGFLVLTASLFQVNAIMGLLVAITILVALVFDFAFLPGLLMWLDRKRQNT
jgi:predicted RND superfamily exporter protein